jgi:hypothetical protein
LIFTYIRIFFKSCNTLINYIPESSIHLSSVTPFISILRFWWTINHLLGWKVIHSAFC